MREGQSQMIHRADYQAPAFWIEAVELSFDLEPAKTLSLIPIFRCRRSYAYRSCSSLELSTKTT